MKNRTVLTAVMLILMLSASGRGADIQTIELPPAQTGGGKPLMQALAERKSVREFSPAELPPQALSNLLWAANGMNRSDGKRTAPSAHDAREVDIYVAKKEGLFLYKADDHTLNPVHADDIRPLAGKQSFVKDAPACLIFATDLDKLGAAEAEFYAAAAPTLLLWMGWLGLPQFHLR